MKLKKLNYILILSFLLFYSCDAKTNSPIINIINSDNNEISVSITPNTTEKFVIVLRENLDKAVFPITEIKNTENKEKIYLSEIERYDKTCYVIFSGKSTNEKKTYKFTIMGHSSQKSFFIDIFTSKGKTNKLDTVFSYPISILAVEPTLQASNIAFSNIKYNSISVSCQNGNGKGRIIIASSDSIIENPTRGVFYKSGEFGKPGAHKIGKNSYVIYNSLENPDRFANLSNLYPGTYYFISYEFNGEGNNTNYNFNFEKRNKVNYTLPLAPPVIKPATNITKDGFDINWEPLANIEKYEVTLSKNENFTEIDEIFNNADVGDITNYPFEQLETGKTYYCKVRAVLRDGQITDFSEPIKIQLLNK